MQLFDPETDLLTELEHLADEVANVREAHPNMRTYSRIRGKVYPNVDPTYKVNKYPFFNIARIDVSGSDGSAASTQLVQVLNRVFRRQTKLADEAEYRRAIRAAHQETM